MKVMRVGVGMTAMEVNPSERQQIEKTGDGEPHHQPWVEGGAKEL